MKTDAGEQPRVYINKCRIHEIVADKFLLSRVKGNVVTYVTRVCNYFFVVYDSSDSTVFFTKGRPTLADSLVG